MNNSPEGKDLGFTHVHLMTFESAAARDAYLPHPEHARFGQLLGRLGVQGPRWVALGINFYRSPQVPWKN